jgi:hypothetical protein
MPGTSASAWVGIQPLYDENPLPERTVHSKEIAD